MALAGNRERIRHVDHEAVRELCWSADDCLWDAYDRSIFDDGRARNLCRLIFPRYSDQRGGKLRVSEQEARFAFAEALSATQFEYSVETPTVEGYQLTGSKPLSAQTDLTVYEPHGDALLNAEFKSKGVSPAAKSSFPIAKDVQKLLREPVTGLWFHLFERINRTSIGNLTNVLASHMVSTLGEFVRESYSKTIYVHICVLEHGFSIHRPLVLESCDVALDALLGQLHVEYKVSRGELESVANENGWRFHYRGR
jgi:hypothetical protein